MRSIFTFSLLITVVAATSYWYLATAAVCPVPIKYRLGTVDERFALSVEEARTVLSRAEAVWEESVGRDLFEYDETSTFTVNFIYDERQQLASTEEEWRLRLDQEEIKSKQLLDVVKELAFEYEQVQAAYEDARSDYESSLAAYNKRVEDLNEQGGAPEPVFAKLQTEKQELAEALKVLLTQEQDINTMAADINRRSEEGNNLVEAYNAEVAQYNQIYGNRDLYTQGDFQRDRINIYKFSDTIELAKVIAHEFGHSLGVGHVEGGESLMYYLMAEQPDALVLSEADKTAFVAMCGTGSGTAYEIRRIIRSVLSHF
jgi:hypothetical protein